MNKVKVTFFICTVFVFSVFGQESVQLIPDGEMIKIIGTRYSVNYENNNVISETVNAGKNVFDGDFNTFFASYESSYTWVGLDLGEKHVITRVAFCPREKWGNRLMLGVMEGANSPDFGDAVPLGIITETPPDNVMTGRSVDNSRGFRYVRYVGPNNVRCNIAELAFYGYPSEGDDSKLTQIANIPDVIIHTVGNKEVTSKEDYIRGIVSFVSEDGTLFYSDSLEIRGRGNASWNFPKKPYRLKLYNSASPLGFPAKAKNWTLINNYGDKTLLRNLLAFDISRRFEMPYTPAGRPVNVYFNGEYKGCYQFCDHIDVRKNRVDIDEMDEEDNSGENLTGGYLVEVDAYAYSEKLMFESKRNKIPVTIKSPDDDVITPEQKTYIIDYFNTLENSAYITFPYTYVDYLDIQTFVRHFLIGELAGNTDTYWSVYMYKPRGNNRFYVGPVWDFDIAFENDNRTYPINNKRDWVYTVGSFPNGGTADFIHRIITNVQPEITALWKKYRDSGAITAENLVQTVDDYAAEIDASQRLNFLRWDILNSLVHQNFQALGSYDAEVDVVRKFIEERVGWIDQKLGYIPTQNEAVSQGIIVSAIHSGIRVEKVERPVLVEVFDVTGRKIFSGKANGDINIPVSRGVAIVQVSEENGNRRVFKCLVQ
ncbi:MAG: CotH kinase family protein [Tannerella sp.]|nr:CotH kinase family protein [Tannerella sp.]